MGSIRKQLTLWLVAAVVGLFALAAAFCYARTESAVERQFDGALRARARALCALAEREPGGKLEVNPAEPSVPEFGDVPHPDYLQIWNADGRTLRRSVSLRGRDIAVPDSPEPIHFWDLTLPDGRPGRGVRLRFVPGTETDEGDGDGAESQGEGVARVDPGADARPSSSPANPAGRPNPRAPLAGADERLTLVLLQDRTPVRHVQKALLSSLLLTLGLLCGGVLLVVPWVVRRGLRGLARVSRQAAQIDASTLSHRLPTQGVPAELRPICDRMNDLLARLEGAFARERRFSANVAHELRTPIAELRSLAEVALRWPGDEPAAAAQAFEDTLAIARQMEAIVNTLLALARCEAGRMPVEFAPLDLASATREAWRPLRARADARRLAVSLDLPADDGDGDAIVSADRAMIAAILSNLLTNAVDYCPPGGAVGVAVRRTRFAVELAVSNTNGSLTADDLNHLLQPFWRKDAARTDSSHSGLGLALVAAYARLHGAELSVNLTDDGRIRVRLTFPGIPRDHTLDAADERAVEGDLEGAAHAGATAVR